MQSGSCQRNRGNNTHATEQAEPIDIDQRSIASAAEYFPLAAAAAAASQPPESSVASPSPLPPPPPPSLTPPLRFHPHLMGQSSSAPRQNSRGPTTPEGLDALQQLQQQSGLGNGGSGGDGGSGANGGGSGSSSGCPANAGASGGGSASGAGSSSRHASELSPEAAAARLRRIRRLRNHMEHFARLGSRLVPASSPSLSSNSSTLRNRVPSLRFRPRSVRYGSPREPSPSPDGARSSATLSQRRRTMPPISQPIPLSVPSFAASSTQLAPDMMDISPVSTVTHHPQQQQQQQQQAPTSPSRRSRMSQFRNSISSWPNISELGSMISRPSLSRRPSETPRPSNLLNGSPLSRRDSSSSTTPSPATATATSAGRGAGNGDGDQTGRPGSSSTGIGTGSRSDRPSMGSSFLDGIHPNNPSRSRPGEDQAAMLSRLLSVAAAATAASLVGNAEEAITQAQDVGGDNGGDGSFESFLRALQNGRLEAALRNGGNEMGGGAAAAAAPADPTAEGGVLSLNFFRMFRFGSTPASSHEPGDGENDEGSGRMVPVIIVGIRSVTPRDATEGGDGNNRPAPFFDALANLPVSIPSMHRRPRFGSGSGNGSGSGSGSSSSSSGSSGTSSGPAAAAVPPAPAVAQRRTPSSGSPARPIHGGPSDSNPFAAAPSTTDTPSGPSPPPTTPADPVLPSFPSGVSFNRRSPGPDPSTAGSFEEGENPTTRDAPPRRRIPHGPEPASPLGGGEGGHRDRRNSTGSGPSRPSLPAPQEGTRSWIIYVLGGSYPENHPILTTPSLFTDEPTYEDMTLLSSLLGPAKLPVAAREDLESAGGVFLFGEGSAEQYGAGNAERCLICLSDYETGIECRQLVKCNHIFHRECIDEWLTTGRNSCPLCRGEGVEEKAKAAAAAPEVPPNVEQTAAAS